ncbi:MAG: cytochrome c [Gammaproteobacteria bacterium]
MKKNNAYYFSIIFLTVLSNPSIAEEIKNETDIVGKKDFIIYCGSCHGSNGEGDGPIVDFLERKPPNLTQLTKNNNGAFPFEQIWGVFDGTYIFAEHGTSEMPIWGYRFVQEAQQNNEQDIASKSRAKALDIVLYLQVIQE